MFAGKRITALKAGLNFCALQPSLCMQLPIRENRGSLVDGFEAVDGFEPVDGFEAVVCAPCSVP